MYAISNKHFTEILEMIESLKDLPGTDMRTKNKKRRAVILIKKLSKSKKLEIVKPSKSYSNDQARGGHKRGKKD